VNDVNAEDRGHHPQTPRDPEATDQSGPDEHTDAAPGFLPSMRC
jgi:hypothetical protein